jgi:hypothetical protein
MNYKSIIGAGAIALASSAASAATVDINITSYAGPGDLAAAVAARDAFVAGAYYLVEEDFSDESGANPVTDVGSFTGVAPAAPGSSAVDCGGGLGATSCVLNSGTFGRYNTDGESNWLDSNDLNEIVWSIPGGAVLSAFNRIAFLMTDVDDVGDIIFQIAAGGQAVGSTVNDGNGQPNGRLQLVTMSFSDLVSNLSITMRVGQGDGFGIDGVKIAAVPVPAAGFLLLAGLGGLAAFKRRKSA